MNQEALKWARVVIWHTRRLISQTVNKEGAFHSKSSDCMRIISRSTWLQRLMNVI
jgi:hypothetical protein